MGERSRAGAPFYAPPRRKTSAEIISEARAAICAEMSATEGSAGGGGGGGGAAGGGAGGAGGALRPLRTRRPFTPREPQRTLFGDRARARDARPPSAIDLKCLSVSESGEEEPRAGDRSKPSVSGEGWPAPPRLPRLSGRSKPLHRRDTAPPPPQPPPQPPPPQPPQSQVGATLDTELARALAVTRPAHVGTDNSLSPGAGGRRRQFAGGKALSCDSGASPAPLAPPSRLSVQLPSPALAFRPVRGSDDNLTLLELGEALAACGRDSARTLALLEAVRAHAERAAPAPTPALRDHVLRALYAHVDCDDERVLVALAAAMLTMRVTGAHLAAACKLVFKIARNDKNDHFFKDTNLLELLVEGCGRADPLVDSECCVYAAGALRFLALEPGLRERARRAGALPLAALHLKILNTAKAERPRQVSEQATHALYQLTGALRNLAGDAAAARAFAEGGALAELLAALRLHTDRDVLTNVARCLSVLSAEEAGCAWLCARGEAARTVLRALAACAARAPLAVRLAYTLGNMAAADPRAGIKICEEPGGADVLLAILESYSARGAAAAAAAAAAAPDAALDPDLHLIGSDLGGSDGSNEDVLIKTVRVLANMCLAEAAGRALAAAHAERTLRALQACLAAAERAPAAAAAGGTAGCGARRGELAAAALATLNNVSFYLEEPPAPPHPLLDVLDSLCTVTCRWARGGVCGVGGAAGCEAVRALGNLTRCARAARLAVLEGALDALPRYLRHEEASVRCAAAGVLVNVCGAAGAGAEAGGAGVEAGGAAARALAAAAAAGDAGTAALLARALWNAHAHAPLPAPLAHHAASALVSLIDDDSVFAECEAAEAAGAGGAGSGGENAHHVAFDVDNNNYLPDTKGEYAAAGWDETDEAEGVEREGVGDGEGEGERCACAPCQRLAAWEELVAVGAPLLAALRPPRAPRRDAAVGTD